LPFADNSFSTILNIFSPSHYEEFKRTLQAGGQVVKVVPQAGYLKELRQAFYPDQVEKQTYSNEAVVNKFKEHLDNVSVKRITYTFDIPIERRQDLLHMSPLEWQVDPTRFAYLMAHPLSTITIDLELLKGNKKD
jgi:23S rRNA (guanine745-N1)-methyltransferase